MPWGHLGMVPLGLTGRQDRRGWHVWSPCTGRGVSEFLVLAVFHRITEWSGLEGISVSHLVQPPAKAGSPTARVRHGHSLCTFTCCCIMTPYKDLLSLWAYVILWSDGCIKNIPLGMILIFSLGNREPWPCFGSGSSCPHCSWLITCVSLPPPALEVMLTGAPVTHPSYRPRTRQIP